MLSPMRESLLQLRRGALILQDPSSIKSTKVVGGVVNLPDAQAFNVETKKPDRQ